MSPNSRPEPETIRHVLARATGIALGTVLAAEAAAFAVLINDPSGHMLLLYGITVPLFAIAVVLLARCRLAPRRALLLVIGVGALFQLVALTHRPTSSDDDYRYIWDAKVQLAGIDPYRYVPQDPHLGRLRDSFLFPTTHCPYRIPTGCTAINRPSVHTVYPPVAEGAFAAIRLASFGDHGGHLPVQLAAALGCVVVAWLLARRVLARNRAPWLVAVWAWCPLPVIAYGNAGHIDWLAVLLSLLGLAAAASGRPGPAGAFVGAAVATKIYPALVLPAMLRRRPGAVIAGAVGVVALSYVPHVFAVGTKVIGYLPGYLREEGYDSGRRLQLLGWVLPHPADTAVGAVLLVAVAGYVRYRADPRAPEDGAVVVAGAAILIATPAYGWYAGLLLALVVSSGALEWLPTAIVPTFGYLMHLDIGTHTTVLRCLYLGAAVVAVVGHELARRRRSSGPRVRAAPTRWPRRMRNAESGRRASRWVSRFVGPGGSNPEPTESRRA